MRLHLSSLVYSAVTETFAWNEPLNEENRDPGLSSDEPHSATDKKCPPRQGSLSGGGTKTAEVTLCFTVNPENHD